VLVTYPNRGDATGRAPSCLVSRGGRAREGEVVQQDHRGSYEGRVFLLEQHVLVLLHRHMNVCVNEIIGIYKNITPFYPPTSQSTHSHTHAHAPGRRRGG
jgi:hypothetical protein